MRQSSYDFRMMTHGNTPSMLNTLPPNGTHFAKKNIYLVISLFCIMVLLLTACAQLSKKPKTVQDAAPKNPKSVKHVPNAVPRVEPLSRYGNPPSYMVFGKTYYVLKSSKNYKARGTASWYGTKFHGKRTSSGEPYDLYAMTAAHKTLPLPTYAKVRNVKNGKEVIVKINDRGPFVGDRLIDLSYAAAKKLGIYKTGTGEVEIVALDPTKHGPKAPVHDINTPDLKNPIYMQLGAFRNKDNAQKLAKSLQMVANANKLPVKIHETALSDGPLFKVRFGPIYSNRTIAHLESELLEKNFPAPTLIFEH